MNKEELSSEINRQLGTDLDWSRMTKDDLLELNEMVEDGELIEKLLAHRVKTYGESAMDEVLSDWKPGTIAKRLI